MPQHFECFADLPVRVGSCQSDYDFDSIQVALEFTLSGEEITVTAARQTAGFSVSEEFETILEKAQDWVACGDGYELLLAVAEGDMA